MAALRGIAPRDTMESLLATQMVATHHAAMECLRRSQIGEQTFAGRDLNLKHAAKLLALYARQMEALDKHRGQGQQKITVEHVNVHAGGQAIVGNVDRPANAPQPAPQAPRLAAPTEMDAPMQILDGAAVVRAERKIRRSQED